MTIVTYPNLPAFDTPEFWRWLAVWHTINNPPDDYYELSVLSLPAFAQADARAADEAWERLEERGTAR